MSAETALSTGGQEMPDPEKFPSGPEIWEMFMRLLPTRDSYSRSHKVSDAGGTVRLWTIQSTDADGNLVEYAYMREGEYFEGFSDESQIHIVHFDNQGAMVGVTMAASFKDGKWVMYQKSPEPK